MSSTILCSEINKTTTYPQMINVSAPNNCGTLSVVCDNSYTDQMVLEMPSILINIYISINGKNSLYRYRSISCNIQKDKIQSFPLVDVPESCVFYIYPQFDNQAFSSHNESAYIWEEECWTSPTQTFPLYLIWNNDNIISGGSGGSPSPTPPQPTTPPSITITTEKSNLIYPEESTQNIEITVTTTKGSKNIQYIQFKWNDTVLNTITSGVSEGGNFSYTYSGITNSGTISVSVSDGTSISNDSANVQFVPVYYYGVNYENTISSLSGLSTTVSVENAEIPINANNQYVIITYEEELGSLTSIKDENGFNYIHSFNSSTIIINNINYKLYVSEAPITQSDFSYYLSRT